MAGVFAFNCFLLPDTCLFVLFGRNSAISLFMYLAFLNSISLARSISISSEDHTELWRLFTGPSLGSGFSLLVFLILGCSCISWMLLARTDTIVLLHASPAIFSLVFDLGLHLEI